MKRISGLWATAFAAATVLSAGAANAGTWQVSAYGGWNGSFNSDVHFTGPGTDWTVSDVPWDGVSFAKSGGAPYYGYRLTYWTTAWKNFGLAIDYTHAKIRAVRDATVNYSGTLDGSTFDGSDQIQNLFDVLEYTDGLNLVFLDGLYKLPQRGIFHPYVGAGLGISIPHVEVTGVAGGTGAVPFHRTFAYEYGGVAAEALVGADVQLTKRIAFFGEYKISYAKVDSPLTGGYKIHTTTITNHVLAGLSFAFGG
jgi:lipid A oxidase